MIKALSIAAVIFGYYLTLVSAQELFCYICARDEGCVNHTNSELYNCYDDLGENPSPTIAVTCYSAFINYSGINDFLGNSRESETGVYRDCGIIPANLGDYCTWFKNELGVYNIPVISCESCNTSRCNRHTFNLEDGSITGNAPGSGNIPMVSLILFFISVVLISVSK